MAAENMKIAALPKPTAAESNILQAPDQNTQKVAVVKAADVVNEFSDDEAFLECPQLNEQSHSSLDYEDDKDFESLSESDLKEQVASGAAIKSEQISPQIVDEDSTPGDLSQTEDMIIQSPISHDAQRPHIMQAPKQLIQNSNRNVNGSIQIRTTNTQQQRTPQQQSVAISTFSKCPEPQAPPTQISQSPVPTFKQTSMKKQIHKSSYKVEKSQQIRKSYTRFVTAHHNQGHSSQRPTQPANILSAGIADGQVYSLPQSVQSMTGIGQVPNGNGRRSYGKGTKGARSKTVKPGHGDMHQAPTSQLKQPISGQAANVLSSANLATGQGNLKAKQVDLLVIGSGPAALGLLVAAIKQQRFSELIQDDGVVILDEGTAFGGGMLSNYGINSNTSANSFLKCIFKKSKDKDKNPLSLLQGTKASDGKTVTQTGIPTRTNLMATASKDTSAKAVAKRRQKSVCKERVNQHQLKVTVATELASKLRNRQMSPVAPISHKRINSRTATSQPPTKLDSAKFVASVKKEETQPLDNTVVRAEEATLSTPILPNQQPHVGQPQEPDAVFEDSVVETQPPIQVPPQDESAMDEQSKIVTQQIQAGEQLLATQKKQTSQNGRKISRDETSQPRNNLQAKKTSAIQVKSAEKSSVSLSRIQSRTMASVKNTQGFKASQNPLAVLQHVIQSGPVPKSLTTQLKARQGDAEKEKKEWTAEDLLTPFKDIFQSNISLLFRKLSKQIVPLSLVGHLLNYVGNHLLHYAYLNSGKRIYFPKHKAISVHLMGNGDILTQVLKTEFTIVPDLSTTPPTFNVVEGQQTIVHFRSKALVIAGGAVQGIDRRVTNEWFPNLAPEKVIPSDSFLKREGYLGAIERLREIKTRSPKVVIIGGSHSGFSCAWLLVKGPAMYQQCFKNLDDDQKPKKAPYANRKQIKNCIPCCSCGNAVIIANAKLAAQKDSGNMQNQRYLEDLRSQSKAGSRAPRGISIAARELSPITKNSRQLSKTIKQKKDISSLKQDNQSNVLMSPDQKNAAGKANDLVECGCQCKCFGFFKYNEWPSLDSESNKLELPTFEDASIKILYRDRIKVFYKTAKQAEQDKYTDYNVDERQTLKKKDGYLHSFTGLRGDAKQLYSDVLNGKEKRVEFVKAGTAELQKPYVEEADIVIWACGYQTNAIKIFDLNKKELVLSQKVPNTQFDVDGKNRVMLADGNVLNKVFACGVGFPVRTKDGGVGNADPSKNPRADSFSLYMHTVGELLLKSLLPKRKIAAIMSHKEAVNPYLKAATYEQIKKDKERKNKKLSLKELQTRKEKGSGFTKLGQLSNPNGFRVPYPKNLTMPDQQLLEQSHLQKEMASVYLSYHRKNGQAVNNNLNAVARPRNGPMNLNTDLEGLTSFDKMYSMASRSNCFSQRTGEDEIKVPIETMLQNTGYSDTQGGKFTPFEGNLQNPLAAYGNNEYSESQETSLKLPEIRAEQTDNRLHAAKQLVDNKKSLTQLSFTDIQIANKQAVTAMPNQAAQIDEESDAELNERDSAHVLSSSSLLQVEKRGGITSDHPSQKSLDRIATSTSRNNQSNIGSQMPSKSPLLLQKKQQMVIQKTREPMLLNSYGPSQLGTMSNLKPAQGTGTGAGAASGKTSHKIKKQQAAAQKRQQTLLDQASPYLYFAMPTQVPDKKVSNVSHAQKTASKRRNAKEALIGTSKEIGTTNLVNPKTQSMTNVLTVPPQSKTGHISKQSTMTGNNQRQHTKEILSTVINQTQKAFSEREQNLGVQYRQLQNLQGTIAPSSKKTKKDHTSVDLTTNSHALKFTQLILDQQNSNLTQLPMTLNQNTKAEPLYMKSGGVGDYDGRLFDIKDTFGLQQQLSSSNQENVYSVKSLISANNNTKLFPPISNKQTTEVIATEWANNSLQNSHGKRKPSHKVDNTDSIQSLTLSAQVSSHHQGQAKKSITKESQGGFSRQSDDSTPVSAATVAAKRNNSIPMSETRHNRGGKIMSGYLQTSGSQQPKQIIGSGQIGTKNTAKGTSFGVQSRQNNQEETNERNTFVLKMTDETQAVQIKNFEAAKQTILTEVAVMAQENSSTPNTAALAAQVDCEDQYADDAFNLETERTTVKEDVEQAVADSHQVPSETMISSVQAREGGREKATSLDKSNVSTQLNPSRSAILRLSSEILPQQKNGDGDQIKNKYLSQAQAPSKLAPPRTDSLMKKFESIVMQKGNKLTEDVAGQIDLHKTSTPHRVTSKKLEQSGLKGRPRIGEISAAASVRRQGASSAVDIQTNSYAGTGNSSSLQQHNQSSSKRATANKKPLSSVGLIEKIINGKEIYPLLEQPQLQQPSHNHQNSLTSVKQMTRKIAQTISASNGSTTNNRMSMRQRQVVESQNAKFKQLVHMPVNEKFAKGKEKADEKLVKSQVKVASTTAKQGGVLASPQPFSITTGGKLPPETPVAERKSAITMPSSHKLQSNQSLSYIRSNQQSSFFVHKTINDLAIKSDNDYIKNDIKRDQSAEDLQESVQINALTSKGNRTSKKESHSKVSHLSPVLKNRGQSKPSVSTKLIALQSSSNPAGKHKSPLRTTLKSAISSNYKDKNSGTTTANHKSQMGTSGLRSPKAVHRNYMNAGSIQQQTDIVSRIADQHYQHKRILSGSRGPTGISNSASQSALAVSAAQAARKDQLASVGRNSLKPTKNTLY